MPELEVVFYEQADGTIPVRQFLGSLSEKIEAKVLRVISLLEKMVMSCESRILSRLVMVFVSLERRLLQIFHEYSTSLL